MFSHKQSLQAVMWNLTWFLKSGVMRPADGFWGVAERLARIDGNAAADRMIASFPCYSHVGEGVVAMEHRRPDCCLQAAWLFDLAADALDKPLLRQVAENILDYMTQRSHLRQRDAKRDALGLWGWSNPINATTHWTDDNAWSVVLLLKLAARGRPELKPMAIETARTIHRHVKTYLERLAQIGWDGEGAPDAGIPMAGLLVNPHWIGLACMALAHAAAADPEHDYRDVVDAYFPLAMQGPPRSQRVHRPGPGLSRPWPFSEYAYLGLAASVVARQFPDGPAGDVARAAGAELLRSQHPDGHFPAEHNEAPAAPHLADLIYTDNWAVLALQHLKSWSGESAYGRAADRALRFLARIQDASEDPRFRGCWRGLFDTQAGAWGGGDHFEGGANSIYSGWTNAPIAWAFLFNIGAGSLFTDADSLTLPF